MQLPFRITKGQVRTLLAENCPLSVLVLHFSEQKVLGLSFSGTSENGLSHGEYVREQLSSGLLAGASSSLKTCVSPILSQPPTRTPPKCILSDRLRYSTGSTEDNWKTNKLGHVCPQLFNCFATVIQAKLFKRFMSNIFPPG